MAFDEELAERIRGLLPEGLASTEKKMFGGLAFLVDGHMAVAAGSHGGLMVRCDPEDAESFVTAPGVARMVMRGREMNGWLLVEAGALADDAALRRWIGVGTTCVDGLPPK